LFLLFSELGSCFKQSLEILLVGLCLEQVDLGEQLFLLLLKLGDFFFQIARVHRFGAECFHVHVSSLKLCLKVLINLECVTHFIVNQEFIWDG
jgi:hypothetical protein